MTMRTPRDEFWQCERVDVIHELFNDQVIGDAQIGGSESQIRKSQIKAVHAERDLVFQPAEIGLLQAGAIPDDERAFALVNILQSGKTPEALAPPWMQIRNRQLRNPSNCIVGIATDRPKRLGNDLLESLFHNCSWGGLITRQTFIQYLTAPSRRHPQPGPARS